MKKVKPKKIIVKCGNKSCSNNKNNHCNVKHGWILINPNGECV